MAEETIEEVWRYDQWRTVLKSCGLDPVQDGIPTLRGTNVLGIKKGGWSSEPESKEHKKLKEWVSQNPQVFKSGISFKNGMTEWLFASADRVDVMFTHASGSLAVEVKSSKSLDADLERGIYQCVKYQALLRAELKARGKIPNGKAILATERKLPQQLQDLADLLGVKVFVVSPV